VLPSIDRASAADLMQFATGDGKAAGHIGAVLVLAAAPGFSVAQARQVLRERIGEVPRLLAMLGTLAGQATETATAQPGRFPAPAPRARELAFDAWRGRLHRPGRPGPAARHQARGLRRIREAIAELGGARPPRRRQATSLNRPTGPRRRLDVVAADLAAVRDLGHARGATVNDVVLAAVAGALRTLLAARGEQLSEITITVPVAARQAAAGGEPGNQIGIMPVTVPAADLGARITRTARITRERKSPARGASAALFVPAFLLLARTGLLRWFTNRQRVVQTFVTNLRGPQDPLQFAGGPVREIIPIPATSGNVTVTSAASSYAGTLRITILSDPDRMPDAPALAAALRPELTTPFTRGLSRG
jgi:diacylglycerol O-acyltransferase / wax synthase